MNEQIKTSRWNTVEFLDSQEDIDAYLEAALETGDPKQISKAMGNAAKAQGFISANKNDNPALFEFATVI